MARTRLDPNQIFQHVYDEKNESLKVSFVGEAPKITQNIEFSQQEQKSSNEMLQILEQQKLILEHLMSRQEPLIIEKEVQIPVEHRTEVIKEIPVEKIVVVEKLVHSPEIKMDESKLKELRRELEAQIKENKEEADKIYKKLIKINLIMYAISAVVGILTLMFFK